MTETIIGRYTVDLDTYDFIEKKWKLKEFTVNIIDTTGSRNTLGPRYVAAVTIPHPMYEYLRENHQDYAEIKHVLKCGSLDDIKKKFTTMTADIEFLVKLEELDNNNKVIIIRFFGSKNQTKDPYMFGDTGFLHRLSFQYFVAFKTYKKDIFDEKAKGFPQYFALRRVTSKIESFHGRKNTLCIVQVDTNSDVEIKWTKEREDYLEALSNKVEYVVASIKDFLTGISEESINKMIESRSAFLLEHKK